MFSERVHWGYLMQEFSFIVAKVTLEMVCVKKVKRYKLQTLYYDLGKLQR